MEYKTAMAQASGVTWMNSMVGLSVFKRAEKELATEVEALAAEGWRPQGGVAVSTNGATMILLQAMIREKPSAP